MIPNGTLTEKELHEAIDKAFGTRWVESGVSSSTSERSKMFDKLKQYYKNPKLLLIPPSEHFGQTWRWDKISTLFSFFRDDYIPNLFMELAFECATDKELFDFSIKAFFDKVAAGAARKYSRKHKDMKYVPSKYENGKYVFRHWEKNVHLPPCNP